MGYLTDTPSGRLKTTMVERVEQMDAKEQFYEAVLDGTTPYVSNVLGLEE